MKKLPKELIFISQINRDGSGTKKVPKSYIKAMLTNSLMKDEPFKVRRLSISEDTYIAMGFNSFVVRLKDGNINSPEIEVIKKIIKQNDKLSK